MAPICKSNFTLCGNKMVDLRERLERLGVRQGMSGLQPSQPKKCGLGIEELVAGELAYNEHGACFVAEENYATSHLHGDLPLSALLDHAPETAAGLARDERLRAMDFRQAAFVDTETTGLTGGTGTYAFLVGVGYFEDDTFRVRQVFMRDPAEERAMLHHLAPWLEQFNAAVSFNGKSFDLPLLETRFVAARLQPVLTGAPHLDLLFPARRLWRQHLDSCALSSLETHVLGLRRTEADAPSYLIPHLYFDYLRSGDARPMQRVFYHNRQDILSLVTLAARMCSLFADPASQCHSDGVVLANLGKLYEDLGWVERAEAAYRLALGNQLPLSIREVTLRRLSFLYKRQGRRGEAVEVWQAMVDTEQNGQLFPFEELAKHYEWHVPNLTRAAQVTRRAIAWLSAQPVSLRQRQSLADLRHRMARLERKLARIPITDVFPAEE